MTLENTLLEVSDSTRVLIISCSRRDKERLLELLGVSTVDAETDSESLGPGVVRMGIFRAPSDGLRAARAKAANQGILWCGAMGPTITEGAHLFACDGVTEVSCKCWNNFRPVALVDEHNVPNEYDLRDIKRYSGVLAYVIDRLKESEEEHDPEEHAP